MCCKYTVWQVGTAVRADLIRWFDSFGSTISTGPAPGLAASLSVLRPRTTSHHKDRMWHALRPFLGTIETAGYSSGGQPGAQKSDSRVPLQLWPKMGGEGGPVPHAPGEPGGAVWKPFSCVLRPSALGRPFSAVSSVLAERFHPSSSSLTIGISPDSVGTFCLPPPILAAKNIFCS